MHSVRLSASFAIFGIYLAPQLYVKDFWKRTLNLSQVHVSFLEKTSKHMSMRIIDQKPSLMVFLMKTVHTIARRHMSKKLRELPSVKNLMLCHGGDGKV